jgi:hypothetical protein
VRCFYILVSTEAQHGQQESPQSEKIEELSDLCFILFLYEHRSALSYVRKKGIAKLTYTPGQGVEVGAQDAVAQTLKLKVR